MKVRIKVIEKFSQIILELLFSPFFAQQMPLIHVWIWWPLLVSRCRRDQKVWFAYHHISREQVPNEHSFC